MYFLTAYYSVFASFQIRKRLLLHALSMTLWAVTKSVEILLSRFLLNLFVLATNVTCVKTIILKLSTHKHDL